MEEHVSVQTEMVVINVYVHLALVDLDVKQVCLSTQKELLVHLCSRLFKRTLTNFDVNDFNYFIGDACTPNPCLNGGTCISNGFGGFTCQCPAGYSGQRCEDRKRVLTVVLIAYFFCIMQATLVLLSLA